MTVTQISPLATVVLDGSGNGQCAIGPPSGTRWSLRLATTLVSSATKQPQVFLYRGSASGPLELIDSTYTGASGSSGKVASAPFYPGQLLWAVWSGGDAGATATLQAYGQQGSRSDPFDAAPVGEGFDNPIVAGTMLIIAAIHSPNYVAGVSGWTINEDGSAEFFAITSQGKFLAQSAVAGDPAYVANVTGDAHSRWKVTFGGQMDWGDGTNNPDTTLRRTSANRLDLATADLAIVNAGRGLAVKEGSNAKMGTATLVAGTKTVSTNKVTASSRIFLCSQVDGGTPGFLRVTTITAATSFVVTSSNAADTSTFAWFIVEPA